jgi:imidazolonepropionase-like amidohydrolase
MEMFVEAGIPLELVLELATHDAAEYLGRLDSIGTIDVGKNADIVLLNNDPRLSVENLKDRRAVIFKGVYHPVEELLQLLEENREAAANFADRMPGNIERHEAH